MKLIFGVLVGIVSHFAFYDAVKDTMLPELYSYAAGVLSTRFVFNALLPEKEPEQAYDYAFATVGLGVLIGRFARMWLTQIDIRDNMLQGERS